VFVCVIGWGSGEDRRIELVKHCNMLGHIQIGGGGGGGGWRGGGGGGGGKEGSGGAVSSD